MLNSSPEAALPAPPVRTAPRRGAWRLRLWHWLLTPGWFRHTPAAKLRGWARVLDWRAQSRAALLVRTLLLPVRAWKEAGQAVATSGATVKEAAAVPRHIQRRQVWTAIVRHGLTARTYYGYLLFRPERWARAAAYGQHDEYFRVVRWYNAQRPDNDAAVMMDKPRFAGWCAQHGLPTVATLLEFESGALVTSVPNGDPSLALPACDLFSKPSEGTGGHGAERWRYDGSGGWLGQDGRRRDAASLVAHLAEVSRTLPPRYSRSAHRIMLQPCLRNHRDLLRFTSGALCTARIVTGRVPGGRARTVGAAYRMACGDASADNFSAGGIVVPVDVTTGELGSAIRRTADGVVPVERHPDTNAVITRARLPFWRETLDLCQHGLDVARGLPSIGWDVAITEEGPVLIEANPASHPGILQRATGIPFSDTFLPDAVDAHMRAYFGL